MAETTTIAVDYGDILSIESGKRPGIRLAQQLDAAKAALTEAIGRKYPADYDLEELAPIETSLATMDVLTESQRDRVRTLIDSFQADGAMVSRDGFGEGKNVCFALWKGSGENRRHIINGLIEPDGRTHT